MNIYTYMTLNTLTNENYIIYRVVDEEDIVHPFGRGACFRDLLVVVGVSVAEKIYAER